MRKVIVVLLTVILAFTFTACGTKGAENTKKLSTEVGLIIDGSSVKDDSYNERSWEAFKSFCSENNIGCQYYESGNSDEESYMAAIDKAVEDNNKVIVLTGSYFEETVYDAQKKYSDVDFLLIDGLPHDSNNKYDTRNNTVSVIFSEEESGYLAGYAAVKDGYTSLGFIGGKEIPAVKRYGYGFAQGAAAAAKELSVKVDLNYNYFGTFKESDQVKSKAESWYQGGTQVIFACGADMNKSVIKAAEEKKGKVIGVDIDQSDLSDTVITSAIKNIDKAIKNVLTNYADNDFGGGTAYTYSARNNGIAIELKNAKFKSFSREDYESIYAKLKKGKINVEKDTEIETVNELKTTELNINVDK